MVVPVVGPVQVFLGETGRAQLVLKTLLDAIAGLPLFPAQGQKKSTQTRKKHGVTCGLGNCANCKSVHRKGVSGRTTLNHQTRNWGCQGYL